MSLSGPARTWATQGHSQSCLQATLVNLLPSLRFRIFLTRSPLRLSQYFCALSLSSTLTSPCGWKTAQQQEAATSTPYFWDGTLQMMSRAGFLQTWCLELRYFRSENLISVCVWGSFFVCKFQVCFHVSSLKRGLRLATLPYSPDRWSAAVVFVLL